MASTGTPAFKSDYEHDPGVVTAWISSYPNNPGVTTVHTTTYEHNPGVMKIYLTSYESNARVKIYMAGCFPKSEFVHTPAGTRILIGALKVGDKISSWNVERKKTQCTVVTDIHKYTVNDIMCINDIMRVSSTHPLMVLGNGDEGILTPKWKVAYDVKVGDCFIGDGGKLVAVKTKSRHWYNDGMEVLNLSTDSGAPFVVGNCVVRAENARDGMAWADAPLTRKLVA